MNGNRPRVAIDLFYLSITQTENTRSPAEPRSIVHDYPGVRMALLPVGMQTSLFGRDVHGNGIPNGTGNPMGIPMGMGIKHRIGNGKWEGMGNHLSGNGNYLHSHGNLFPKVLCCDELIKLIITLNVPSA